jgi:hypothetical protein
VVESILPTFTAIDSGGLLQSELLGFESTSNTSTRRGKTT